MASALEVRPFNERTSGSDSFIDARSARKNCAGGDGGKLLRFACRETADEIGRAAGWLSPENSRADHQSSRPRAFWLLQIFCGEARAGAGRGGKHLSQTPVAVAAGKTVPRYVREKKSRALSRRAGSTSIRHCCRSRPKRRSQSFGRR